MNDQIRSVKPSMISVSILTQPVGWVQQTCGSCKFGGLQGPDPPKEL